MRAVESLQDLSNTERNALVGRPEQVAATMSQGESGEHPPRLRVEDRGSLARQIRQHQQPLATGRNGLRLGHQRIERCTTRYGLEPSQQTPSGGCAGCQGQGAALDARRGPQRGVAVIRVDDLHQEHGGPVHQHQVAGMAHPDRERLRVGVDGARDHGRARGDAGSRRGVAVHGTDDIAGPYQPRQRQVPTDTLRPFGVPVELADCVQRIALARGVVVHHVFTAELGRDVGVGPVPSGGTFKYLRLMATDPFQLRPHGLA
jgi:hypothetical protein